MFSCRAAWQRCGPLARKAVFSLPKDVVQRRPMSSMPGGSGENILYAVLCGGAGVACVTYAYKTVTGDQARYEDRMTQIRSSPIQSEWVPKPWPHKSEGDEEEEVAEEEVAEEAAEEAVVEAPAEAVVEAVAEVVAEAAEVVAEAAEAIAEAAKEVEVVAEEVAQVAQAVEEAAQAVEEAAQALAEPAAVEEPTAEPQNGTAAAPVEEADSS